MLFIEGELVDKIATKVAVLKKDKRVLNPYIFTEMHDWLHHWNKTASNAEDAVPSIGGGSDSGLIVFEGGAQKDKATWCGSVLVHYSSFVVSGETGC